MYRSVLLQLIAALIFIPAALAAPLNIQGWETGGEEGCQSNTGTRSVSSATFRSGAYALRVNPTTTAVGNCRVATMASTGIATTGFGTANLYSRFYFRAATLPASNDEEVFVVLDTSGTQMASIRINSAGNLTVYDNAQVSQGTGSTALSLNTWYRIEFRTQVGATGSFELLIDGVTEDSGTMAQGSTNHGSVRVGKGTNRNSQTIDVYYDDVAIDDSAYPGAGSIVSIGPDGNGSTAQWTAGTGSSNHAEVDERPTDDDTTYVQKSSSASEQHLVTLESATSAGVATPVYAVKGFIRCKESTSVTSATRIRIRSSATNSDSSTLNGTTSYANQFRLLTTDPNGGGAWTLAGLDALEMGAEDTAATASVRCTAMRLEIDYQPSSATPTPTSTPTPTATATATATPTSTATPTPTATPIALRLLGSTGVGR